MRNDLPTNRNMNRDDSLESALAMLQPAPSRIDRDKIMYAAGQSAASPNRTASPRRWLWPTMTVLSLLAAVTSLGLYASATNRPPRTRIVYVDRPVPVSPANDDRDAAAKLNPRDAKRQPPAVVEHNRMPRDPEPTSLVSTMARSRYPILLTDADHLPDTATGGSPRKTTGRTFAAMRKRMTGRPTKPNVIERAKSPLFFWRR